MKSQWMLISGLLFALLIAIFAVINVDAVEVNYLFGSTRTPLILVIMISTLLGGLLVGSIGMLRFLALQRRVKQLEKQLLEAKAPEGLAVVEEVKYEESSAAEIEDELSQQNQK